MAILRFLTYLTELYSSEVAAPKTFILGTQPQVRENNSFVIWVEIICNNNASAVELLCLKSVAILKKMTLDIPGFAYAATVAAGGILGYVKSNSIPSLAAGLLFGSILGYGSYQTSQDPNNYGILLGTSSALGGLMYYRYYKSGKIMPAGVVTLISTAMVIRLLVRHFSPSLTEPKQQ